MSQEALKLLKEIEWEYDGVYRRCRLCLHDPHRENCPHVRLLSLLEAQPEPGEFTKEAREYTDKLTLEALTPNRFYTVRDLAKCRRKLDEACDRIDRQQDLFRQLDTWCRAYPLDIFPKPDLKKAHEVLKANGLTLDAISADNMRHVLDGIKDIVEQGLKGE